jgi:hypothetical protein
VLEPLEENRAQMMLVTEAVSASVYDVLHQVRESKNVTHVVSILVHLLALTAA